MSKQAQGTIVSIHGCNFTHRFYIFTFYVGKNEYFSHSPIQIQLDITQIFIYNHVKMRTCVIFGFLHCLLDNLNINFCLYYRIIFKRHNSIIMGLQTDHQDNMPVSYIPPYTPTVLCP